MAISSETKIKDTGNKEWSLYKVLDTQSVDETTSAEIEIQNVDNISLIVVTSAGVSGGVVELETSPESEYAGTWLTLRDITVSSASKIYGETASITDNLGLPSKYVRARISTVISGGTVDVYIGIQRN
jgi:hypothetical protein